MGSLHAAAVVGKHSSCSSSSLGARAGNNRKEKRSDALLRATLPGLAGATKNLFAGQL